MYILDHLICFILRRIPNKVPSGKFERWLIRVLMKIRGTKW